MSKIIKTAKRLLIAVILLTLCSCSKEPASIDKWKAWVLTKANAEGYSAFDLVDQFADDRVRVAKFVDYHEKFEQWWIEEINFKWRGHDEYYTESDNRFHLEQERKDFKEYYQTLAEMTLMNALCYYEDEDVENIFVETLGLAYAQLMGNEFVLMQWYETVEERIDLNNLENLTKQQLRKTMVELVGDENFSMYGCALAVNHDDENKWWEAADIAYLAREHQDEFFENIMAFFGDFNELKKAINDAVKVYSCEYNSELSSSKADVYDVIYSIKDKMYVKCTILESEGKSEIKINNKSTHLLSL